jgi:hypothetical protein
MLTPTKARSRFINDPDQRKWYINTLTQNALNKVEATIFADSKWKHSSFVSFPELFSADHLRCKDDGDWPDDCESRVVEEIIDNVVNELKYVGYKVKRLSYNTIGKSVKVPKLVISWFGDKEL